MKLLIAEDNKVLQRAYLRFFRRFTVTLYFAETVKEALEMIDAGLVPDAVLSDYDLGPDGNGIDLLTALREKFPSAPMVLSSGNVTTALDTLVSSIDVQFLPKPFTMGVLEEMLEI